MRILIPTIGAFSDVQPYLPLARGLQCEGHEVIVASHPALCGVIESCGVRFAPIGPSIDIVTEAVGIHRESRNQTHSSKRASKLLLTALEQAHDDLLELCRWSDWVIIPHNAAGSIEADQLDLPTISVTIMPQVIPANDPSRHSQAQIADKSSDIGMNLTRPLNQIRRRMGVGPMGRTGFTSPWLNLIPVSPHVVAPDPCWEPRHHMTGYWFDLEPRDQRPPESLMAFLARGPKPVVISLGEMLCNVPDLIEAAHMIVNTVQQAGLRATIHGWEHVLRGIPMPDTVLPIGPAPTSWLLQQASGMVSNGDFSAVGSAIQAGIPLLVIPSSGDQFSWGSRIHALGMGPAPLPERKLTAESLQEALRELVHNDTIRKQASAIGEQIRSEHGIENALRLIDIAFWAAD